MSNGANLHTKTKVSALIHFKSYYFNTYPQSGFSCLEMAQLNKKGKVIQVFEKLLTYSNEPLTQHALTPFLHSVQSSSVSSSSSSYFSSSLPTNSSQSSNTHKNATSRIFGGYDI